MKTYENLKKLLVDAAINPAHVSPALERLCGIIDRQNRRIDALEKIVHKAHDE